MAVLGRHGILRIDREMSSVPYIAYPEDVNLGTGLIQVAGEQFATGYTATIAVTPENHWSFNQTPYSVTYFIHKNAFDQIGLYYTLEGALNQTPTAFVGVGFLYTNSVFHGGITNAFSSLSITTSLGWRTQAQINDWTLNLTNSEIDTTSLGDSFTEAVKSGVVSGSGSINFLVDRLQSSYTYDDSVQLFNLLLSSDAGSRAHAEFWMINNRQAPSCGDALPGSLFYTADILITASVINTSADNIISGSAEFLTVGEITLESPGLNGSPSTPLPLPPEPGPGSPTQIDSAGVKSVGINYQNADLVSGGSFVISWTGSLQVVYNPATQITSWVERSTGVYVGSTTGIYYRYITP